MAEKTVAIQIALPLVVGLIIGVLEALFVYEDENMTSGKEFLKDMWHGLLFAVLGTMTASNVPWLVQHDMFPSFLKGLLLVDANGNSLIICGIISIFMMLKMVASHAIKGISGGGLKEKIWHKLGIALLVGFAPYYILLLDEPLAPVLNQLPSWLR